jgi:peptidoglycan/LPS O-acetylase OafA/YrhL
METNAPVAATARPTLNHFRQLDGVRFIAVALVLIDHWLTRIISEVPLGSLGVTIFFVLSGFLITRILLSSKEKLKKPTSADQPNSGLGKYLKTFYIRRTLRIFPIYYLTIIILAIINEPPVRKTFAWLALYATNIYIAVHQTWMGTVDHLWSLAVEEQVYLILPLLLFFVPRRYVPLTMLLMTVLSIGLRYILYYAHFEWFVGYVSTFTCLDSFGLGGIMAYGWLYKRDLFIRIFQPSHWVWISLAAFVAAVVANHYITLYTSLGYHNPLSDVWERFIASVFGAFLIGRAVLGFDGVMKWILENAVSQYMGRISYGLYLYHNFVYNVYHTQPTHFTARAWRRITDILPFLNSTYFFKFSFFVALTITLATISWYLIEKPINNLKDRYSY